MDKTRAAAEIIEKALPLVPFDGWSQSTLEQAAVEAGYQKSDIIRIFPGGAIDAVDAFIRLGDAKMEESLRQLPLDTMKIREKVSAAVRERINAHEGHREAVRKTVALQMIPFYYPHAMRNLYRTVDAIWHAIGDTSTDFNFYTKRMMLSGVYASTLLYWLNDTSPGYVATWAFLDRRIADVMRIEKAKYKMKEWTGWKRSTR
jgi:ubiquinone biosynthesis protein COQ9